MWIVIPRRPRAVARVWAGRRLLASVDAITWPAGWAVLVSHSPVDVGLLGRASVALVILLAVRGLTIAIWHNERYGFVSWRLFRLMAALLLVGASLQAAFWLAR